MPPQKLSDSDKQDILALYRATEETTSSLASRYGVSNTTISRILKQSLSNEEYETLIHQKRTGGKSQPVKPASKSDSVATQILDADIQAGQVQEEQPEIEPSPIVQEVAAVRSIAPPQKRQRKRSTAAEETDEQTIELAEPVLAPSTTETQLPLLELSAAIVSQNVEVQAQSNLKSHPLQEMIEGDLISSEEDFADLDDDEDEDDDEDDDDLDDELDDDDLDDDDDDESDLAAVQVQSKAFIQVLPLAEAAIPKTCYLVVDRASELITRPLRDFAELGQIPTEEIQAKTLPIFDNHRVARRFSRRMQRVVKVPDGRVLQKVGSYLQAKGITRLLIDGQVYSI